MSQLNVTSLELSSRCIQQGPGRRCSEPSSDDRSAASFGVAWTGRWALPAGRRAPTGPTRRTTRRRTRHQLLRWVSHRRRQSAARPTGLLSVSRIRRKSIELVGLSAVCQCLSIHDMELEGCWLKRRCMKRTAAVSWSTSLDVIYHTVNAHLSCISAWFTLVEKLERHSTVNSRVCQRHQGDVVTWLLCYQPGASIPPKAMEQGSPQPCPLPPTLPPPPLPTPLAVSLADPWTH